MKISNTSKLLEYLNDDVAYIDSIGYYLYKGEDKKKQVKKALTCIDNAHKNGWHIMIIAVGADHGYVLRKEHVALVQGNLDLLRNWGARAKLTPVKFAAEIRRLSILGALSRSLSPRYLI